MKSVKTFLPLVAVLALVACSKQSDVEPVVKEESQQVDQIVSMSADYTNEQWEDDGALGDDLRLISYDFHNASFYLPKFVLTNDMGVHAFFKNTKDGNLVYQYLDASTLTDGHVRDINLRGKYNATNQDHWYVKCFVSGIPFQPNVNAWPSKQVVENLVSNGTANALRFMFDQIWTQGDPNISVTTTINIDNDYYLEATAYTEYPSIPFPMQTEWVKVNFHKLADGTDNKKTGATKLHFKPFGSLIRLGIFYNTNSTNWLGLNSISTSYQRNGTNPLYVNHTIMQMTDQPLTLNSDGTVNQSSGHTWAAQSDGSIHYHSWRGTVLYHQGGFVQPRNLWLWRNPASTNSQDLFMLRLYIADDFDNSGKRANPDSNRVKYKVNPEGYLYPNTLQDGKAYRIGVSIRP